MLTSLVSFLISAAETISVDQTVAQVFRLRPYQDVHVNVVDPKVCVFATFFHLSLHFYLASVMSSDLL